MANAFYNKGKAELSSGGGVSWTGDTIKIALVTSAYTPDIDAHDFFNDVTNEVSGTGYTAGGATLASKTKTQDNATDRIVFDAADPTWASSTITARGAVVYKDTGNAATSPLLAYIDFGTNISSTGAAFTITFSADGVIYLG